MNLVLPISIYLPIKDLLLMLMLMLMLTLMLILMPMLMLMLMLIHINEKMLILSVEQHMKLGQSHTYKVHSRDNLFISIY